ncbi:hypothetical protein [Lachnobacterium bovis]|uniref:hypothetical protein n=1 Tax=Lachnobacterium bovis TaxID=140626 RepID=UPI0004158843|nr:hypothetical protein [Lachnobacterium bovis]
MKQLVNEENIDVREKRWKKIRKRLIIGLVLILPIVILYCVPFDFKYVKMKPQYKYVGFSDVELVERSMTPDDSVCLVVNEKDNDSCNIQRISSNRFTNFKAGYSQRKFDFSTTLKNHYYYEDNDNDFPFHFKKRIYDEDNGPRDSFVRMDSLKIQYYNIDKKKIEKEEEIMPYLKKYDENNALYGINMNWICFLNDNDTGKPVVYCNGKMLQKNSNGYQVFIDPFEVSDEYDRSTHYEKRGYMGSSAFDELLKVNGVKRNDVYYFPCDPYCDIYFSIVGEELPKSNAKLYKVYPKLKKYIGKKNKNVKFFIKGISNPDQLVEYFLPNGQKVTYGKSGLNLGKIEGTEYKGKVCRNFQEYLEIHNQVETQKE